MSAWARKCGVPVTRSMAAMMAFVTLFSISTASLVGMPLERAPWSLPTSTDCTTSNSCAGVSSGMTRLPTQSAFQRFFTSSGRSSESMAA